MVNFRVLLHHIKVNALVTMDCKHLFTSEPNELILESFYKPYSYNSHFHVNYNSDYNYM